MLRSGPLPCVLAAALYGWTASAAEPRKPAPTPTPAAKGTPSEKKPKRVFTNDDLEATRDKPSAVQDATATGGSIPPYEPVAEPETAPPPPGGEQTETERQIAELEASIKAMDEQANQILWTYLQSTDTNEIMRLKAEQKEVIDRMQEAKAELARLRGEPGAGPSPTPTPERERGR